MSEKPILFNTEMVKAILNNMKTSTRRIIKGVQGLDFIGFGMEPKEIEDKAAFGHGSFEDIVNAKIEKYIKPPYQIGDTMWVRETWQQLVPWNEEETALDWDKAKYCYAADGTPNIEMTDEDGFQLDHFKWRPSIHMPRAAARIFLKVTDVKVQRIQDITRKEIFKEGTITEEIENSIHEKEEKVQDFKDSNIPVFEPDYYREAFKNLWDNLYENKGYGWGANPWVWNIEFERCEEPK